MQYIDIQCNGYGGVEFYRGLADAAGLNRAADRLEAGNVRAILATVTTDDLATMEQRLRQLRAVIDADARLRRLMPAFHIEGPCISPVEGYRGAHPPQHIRSASVEVMKRLVDAGGGPSRVALVTLAPEVDAGLKTTRWLVEQGMVVSAGHTDASRECLRDAVAAGLKLFTHLGNGAAAMMNRHDNIITRALSLDGLHYSLIPDGHHLPFWVLRHYIRVAGVERCILTTDCVGAADAGPDYVPVPGSVLDASNDTPVLRLEGTPYLAGSVVTMAMGCRNAVKHAGFSEADAKRLCHDNPAAMFRRWLD